MQLFPTRNPTDNSWRLRRIFRVPRGFERFSSPITLTSNVATDSAPSLHQSRINTRARFLGWSGVWLFLISEKKPNNSAGAMWRVSLEHCGHVAIRTPIKRRKDSPPLGCQCKKPLPFVRFGLLSRNELASFEIAEDAADISGVQPKLLADIGRHTYPELRARPPALHLSRPTSESPSRR